MFEQAKKDIAKQTKRLFAAPAALPRFLACRWWCLHLDCKPDLVCGTQGL